MDKIKQLLMSHGEKLVAVLCGGLGLLALTSANWAPDNSGTPEGVISSVQKQLGNINSPTNTLPSEELDFFKEIPDVIELTKDENKQLTNPADFALAEFSTPLNQVKEKRSRPDILKAIAAIADPVQFPALLKPEMEDKDEDKKMMSAESEKDADAKEMSDLEKELLKKIKRGSDSTGSNGFGAGMGGPPGLGAGMGGPPGLGGGGRSRGGQFGDGDEADEGGGSGSRSDRGQPSGGFPGGNSFGGGSTGELLGGGFGGGLGGSMTKVEKRIRPSAGISVRAIVPMQEQRRKLLKALHLKGGFQAAQQFIRYTDLQVQRRRIRNGKSEDWIDLSTEDLGEILKDSQGIDIDIVSPAVARNTITMPLPRRAAGVWSASEASHPMIEDFVLNEEEKEIIDKLNALAKKKAEETKAAQGETIEDKGFSSFVKSAVDFSSNGSDGIGLGSNLGDEFQDSFNSTAGEGEELSDSQRSFIDETLQTADQRLLLVRFMDFTVERGYAYQYRIRLEMANPNYRHPLDELEDPSLASETTLTSEWSEPTPVTFLPVGQRIYVTDVRTSDKVNFSVYSDTVDTGLPVFGSISVEPGMRISGKDTFDVVDLTKDVLENREVFIGSDDILLSAKTFGRIGTSDHAGLKPFLSQLPRGTDAIPDQICILNAAGDLELRSVGDQSQQLAADKLYAKIVLEEYEPWRTKGGEESDNPFGGLGEGDGEGEDGQLGTRGRGSSAGTSN